MNSQITNKGKIYSIKYNFLFTLALMLFTTSNSLNLIHLNHRMTHQFVPQSLEYKNYKLKDYHINYYINSKNENACDIHVKEVVSYESHTTVNEVVHSILSKKLPYTDFKVSIITPGVRVYKTNIEKSNEHRKYFITKGESQIYRDRWIITTQLSTSVSKVTVEYEYTIQRGIMIDPLNEYDLIRVSIINPFSERLYNLKLSVFIENFKNLENKNIQIPPFSKIQRKDNNLIEIFTERSLPVYGQLLMQFTLPLEITVCEPNMVKLVYYGMIGMTASFIIIAIVAFAYIYKE
jgi:hypothetical protein